MQPRNSFSSTGEQPNGPDLVYRTEQPNRLDLIYRTARDARWAAFRRDVFVRERIRFDPGGWYISGEASLITRPCIVVPGIQGSTLQNFYPIDPVTTWSTMAIAESKLVALDFNSLALTDDGLADRGSLVVSRPSALIELAYAPLVSGLQARAKWHSRLSLRL
jgi:hypothetical protein